MIENGVELEIFPLVFNKKKFRYARFYLDVLRAEADELDPALLEPAEKLEELSVRLKRKEFKKRVLGRLDFQLAGGTKVGAKLFSLFRKFKKPPAKVLLAESGALLTRITKHRCKQTGRQLAPEQTGRYFPLGDEKVVFAEKEIEALRAIAGQQFVLLGFKPRAALKVYHNTGPSVFVVGDDERVTNSSKLFDALIKEMLRRDRIAIVKAKIREKSSLRFCALVPQEERRDKEGALVPAGFHMLALPFGDEIRRLDGLFPAAQDPPTDRELACATELVRSLTVEDFDPRTFENPEVQKFFAVLQALALREELPEGVTDYLQPDFEGLESRIEVFQAFNECFFGKNEGFEAKKDRFELFEEKQVKIRKEGQLRERKAKEVKEEDGLRLVEIKKKIIQRDVKSLKLADLEFVMKEENIKLDRKLAKKDLVEQLAQLI